MSRYDSGPSFWGSKRGIFLIFSVLSLIIGVAAAGNLFEQLNAGEVMVVQAPLSGELTWHVEPGLKWQGFGTITKYPKRSTYELNKYKVRFNDGGHAQMTASVNYMMPLNEVQLNKIHSEFSSWQALNDMLIAKTVKKVVYLTGPLMSSKESYAEGRPQLISLIDDQIENGVYQTTQVTEWVKDEITGEREQNIKTEIVRDETGVPKRQDSNGILGRYGIEAFNFAIEDMPYEERVENQINKQQDLKMAVQTAIAKKAEAEQRKQTAKAEGEAAAAQAKWEQEKLKATAITLAEQEKEVAETKAQQQLEVAKLERQAEEENKQRKILEGEGDAEKRRLAMQADNALEQRLAAWVAVNRDYAKAIATHNGPMVPLVTGTSGEEGSSGGSVNDLIRLMMAQSAQQVGVNMTKGFGATN